MVNRSVRITVQTGDPDNQASREFNVEATSLDELKRLATELMMRAIDDVQSATHHRVPETPKQMGEPIGVIKLDEQRRAYEDRLAEKEARSVAGRGRSSGRRLRSVN